MPATEPEDPLTVVDNTEVDPAIPNVEEDSNEPRGRDIDAELHGEQGPGDDRDPVGTDERR